MTRNVLTAGADWTLDELKSFLIEHGISGAPVADRTGKLVGVISATDILRSEDTPETTDRGYFATSLDRPLGEEELDSLQIEGAGTQVVADLMTPVVFQASADTSLDDAADTMVRGRIHRIVVTEDDAVVGIVTALDLVRTLRDVLRQNR
jgi:CBS domain-containing protein